MIPMELSLHGLIEIYRAAESALSRERDRLFPQGVEVTVNQPGRYRGNGVTADSSDLPPNQVAVQIENGNVWSYGIEFVKRKP